MSDVWVQTTAGLVRAEAIVAVAVTSGRLVVRLGTTGGGAGGVEGWAVGPEEYTVSRVHPNDGGLAARSLVEYIAWIRGRGESGVVVVGENGNPGLDTFDDQAI